MEYRDFQNYQNNNLQYFNNCITNNQCVQNQQMNNTQDMCGANFVNNYSNQNMHYQNPQYMQNTQNLQNTQCLRNTQNLYNTQPIDNTQVIVRMQDLPTQQPKQSTDNYFKNTYNSFIRYLIRRKRNKKRSVVKTTAFLFVFFLLFLPKITFGFAPSIWITLSNSDSAILQMYTEYIDNVVFLAPAAKEEVKEPVVEDKKVDGLTNHQLDVAGQLISLFENGTTTIQYAYCDNIGDGAGYTSGRAGFCTGTGDALEVIKRYTKIVPDNALKKYITELQKIADKKKSSGSVSGINAIGDYRADWKKCCKDTKFIDVQDDVFYDFYYDPSKEAADELGSKLAITRAELFDSAVNSGVSGMNRFIRQTNQKMGGSPSTGVDEVKWIAKYLEVRAAYLKTTRYSSITYRTSIVKEILDAKNYDLSKKIVVKHSYFKGTVIE